MKKFKKLGKPPENFSYENEDQKFENVMYLQIQLSFCVGKVNPRTDTERKFRQIKIHGLFQFMSLFLNRGKALPTVSKSYFSFPAIWVKCTETRQNCTDI